MEQVLEAAARNTLLTALAVIGAGLAAGALLGRVLLALLAGLSRAERASYRRQQRARARGLWEPEQGLYSEDRR